MLEAFCGLLSVVIVEVSVELVSERESSVVVVSVSSVEGQVSERSFSEESVCGGWEMSVMVSVVEGPSGRSASGSVSESIRIRLRRLLVVGEERGTEEGRLWGLCGSLGLCFERSARVAVGRGELGVSVGGCVGV